VRALVSAVHICVIEASYTRRSPACAHTTDSETTKLAGSSGKEGGWAGPALLCCRKQRHPATWKSLGSPLRTRHRPPSRTCVGEYSPHHDNAHGT
jgi:hypothetical protein